MSNIPILQADAKRAMGQLADFSNEELDEILSSEEKFKEIIAGIENVSKKV